MATEEHYPSLYSALYGAITDHKLVGDLLEHPEFRRKAEQICNEIAGPAGGGELLQEACPRVLESVDDLGPDSIRSEGEFFAWFSRLARCVHVSRILSAATANNCTDVAACWPDSSADVPSDDMGRFLAHADECLYHARILRAEDEQLRAAFDRARGLDSRGRILLGEELKERIADHRRRLQNWCEAALRKGELYGQVALFNEDRKVASCGWFSDFSNHRSRHELNPDAGLQIRGVSGDPDGDVLLGFYPLAGVRHGGGEKVLKLDNGYAICLQVESQGGNCFEINFRCVDTKTLESDGLTTGGGAAVIINGASGDVPLGNSPRSPEPAVSIPPGVPVQPKPAGRWTPPRSVHVAAMFALLLVVAVPCFLMGRTLGRTERVENIVLDQLRTFEARVGAQGKVSTDMGWVLSELKAVGMNPLSRIEPLTVYGEGRQPRRAAGPEPPEDAGVPAPRSKQEQTQGAGALSEDPTRKDEVGRLPDYKGLPNSGPGIDELYRRLPAFSNPNLVASGSAPRGKFTNEVDDRRSETPIPTPMVSYEEQGLSAGNSVLDISTNGSRRPANNPVLHITEDGVLANKLYKALREQSLRVEPPKENSGETPRFTVTWNARIAPTGEIKVVELFVDISKGRETNFVERRSYRGVGHSLNAAYNDAVEQAVKPVVEWIKNRNAERLSASGSETGGEGRPVAVLPKENEPAEYKEGSGTEASDRRESEPDTPVRGRDGRGGPMWDGE